MSFFTGFITSRRWAFEEMFRGLKRNAGANAFAVLLSALALTIPLWIALVFYGLSEPLRSLPTSVELTVFTKEGADAVIECSAWTAVSDSRRQPVARHHCGRFGRSGQC